MNQVKRRIGDTIVFQYEVAGGPLDGCRYRGVITSIHMNEYMVLVNKKESHMIKDSNINEGKCFKDILSLYSWGNFKGGLIFIYHWFVKGF